jgi:DNA polymerase (family X)
VGTRGRNRCAARATSAKARRFRTNNHFDRGTGPERQTPTAVQEISMITLVQRLRFDVMAPASSKPYAEVRCSFFRLTAWHRGVYAGSIADLAVSGKDGLEAVPGIGPTIAASVRELVETGQLRYLRRLEGDAPAETLLRTVPGIGASTAHRIHMELGVETLEDLEVAVHDGRLRRPAHCSFKPRA